MVDTRPTDLRSASTRARVRIAATAALLVAVPVTLSACTNSMDAASTGAHAAVAGPPPSLTVTPAAAGAPGRGGPPPRGGTEVTNGIVTSVTLNSTDGETVFGSLRPDGSSWVPSHPLRFGEHYTATVTATGADGQTKVSTTRSEERRVGKECRSRWSP